MQRHWKHIYRREISLIWLKYKMWVQEYLKQGLWVLEPDAKSEECRGIFNGRCWAFKHIWIENSKITDSLYNFNNSDINVNCRGPSYGKRRKWQPTSVFLPGKSDGQRSLMGYSPWGRKRVRHNLATKQQNYSNMQVKNSENLKLLAMGIQRSLI